MRLPAGVGIPEIIVILLALFVLLDYRTFAKKLQDAFNDFRGGPPSSHPLPGNDAEILNRHRSKSESDQL